MVGRVLAHEKPRDLRLQKMGRMLQTAERLQSAKFRGRSGGRPREKKGAAGGKMAALIYGDPLESLDGHSNDMLIFNLYEREPRWPGRSYPQVPNYVPASNRCRGISSAAATREGGPPR